jgi:hypothetical protein
VASLITSFDSIKATLFCECLKFFVVMEWGIGNMMDVEGRGFAFIFL